MKNTDSQYEPLQPISSGKAREVISLPPLTEIETPGQKVKEKKVKEKTIEKRKDVPPHKNARAARNYKTFFLLSLTVFILLIGMLVGFAVGILNQYLDKKMPKISYLDDYRPWMPSRMFSGDESRQMVADFFGDGQNRTLVPLSEIPTNLKNALIAIEDKEFYDHPGISLRGFIRAAYKDIKNHNLAQGGSTITMQLAEDLIKNKRLDFELPEMGLKSFQQKIMEILLSLQIEKRFTKNEILEFYLNQVFMGGNIYGMAAAAEYYFDKEISQLSLKECALFAGMQQRPNAFSPTKNPEKAQARTQKVLNDMLDSGFITQAEYEQALNEPFQLNTQGTRRTQIALHPYFSYAVRRQFQERQIVAVDHSPIEVLGRGIDIESTMNVFLQQAAESALKKGIVDHEHARRRLGGKHWGEAGYRGANLNGPDTLQVDEEYDAKITADYNPQEGTVQVTLPNIKKGQGPFSVAVIPDETWLDEFDLLHKDYFIRVKAYQEGNEIRLKLAKDEYVQGSLIAVRPTTGEVLAQVGGYDFNDMKNGGQFIRSVQATTLQPGSAFKPLLYAAALSDPAKHWNITSLLHDIRKEYWSGWTPRNFYNEYFGPVTMNYSLTHSLNAASVWLLDNYKPTRSAGIDYLRTFCRDVFGFTVEEANLSIALGTTGTTPMEVAQAYSVFANQGVYVPLHMVNKVFQRQVAQRKTTDQIYEFKPNEIQQRLSPQVAYLVTSMLRSVVDEGTGQPAKELPFFSVGKTGTTDESTYAWFAGYSKDILCVVYMGYDDFQRSLGSKMTGAKVALPIWIEFMKRAYEIKPELFGEIEPPSGIVFHEVCGDRNSGKLATPQCPSKINLPFEKGAEPLEECSIHGQDSTRPYRNVSNQLILSDQQRTDYDPINLSVE